MTDWANTKVACRFLSNERVSEADILAGHFNATRDRSAATDGIALILHDTTEFSYQRESTDAIGVTKATNIGGDKDSRLRARWLENVRKSTCRLAAPERCVHIGDRESDIYERFCAAQDASTLFLAFPRHSIDTKAPGMPSRITRSQQLS